MSDMSDSTSIASRALIARTADWLMAQVFKDSDLETIVRGCCERLLGAGLPIARVQLSFSMLHPLYRGVGYTWRRAQGLRVDAYRHMSGGVHADRFLKSPYYHLLKHDLDHLRRRLDGNGPVEFPIFEDFRAEGLTDYLAFTNSFAMGTGQGMLGSWATDRRGGFSDGDIEAMLRIQDPLAVACKMTMRGGVAKSALDTYLGASAGGRVLAGQIKRGDGETIRAAIVWGDLRNSTMMAEQLSRQAYIDNLNAFFDASAGAIAIFPCDRNQKASSEACKLALSAALDATGRMTETNRQRADQSAPSLGYGLSLHIGNVMFGNVGLAERLSFSVFGSTVNESARLESLTKKFATPIVASEEFTTYCGGAWVALGAESMRGVSAPMNVFRPSQTEGVTPTVAPAAMPRNRSRDFSDAEQVVLLFQDSPE